MPTSDRLRHDIDRGHASDKVSFPDPAMAPLGTDDEAGGTPPTPERIELARDQELNRPVASAPRSEGPSAEPPAGTNDAGSLKFAWVGLGIAVIVVLVAVVLLAG
jgi:hypothetical protein